MKPFMDQDFLLTTTTAKKLYAVAEKMLDGTLCAGDTARLTFEDDQLQVTK